MPIRSPLTVRRACARKGAARLTCSPRGNDVAARASFEKLAVSRHWSLQARHVDSWAWDRVDSGARGFTRQGRGAGQEQQLRQKDRIPVSPSHRSCAAEPTYRQVGKVGKEAPTSPLDVHELAAVQPKAASELSRLRAASTALKLEYPPFLVYPSFSAFLQMLLDPCAPLYRRRLFDFSQHSNPHIIR